MVMGAAEAVGGIVFMLIKCFPERSFEYEELPDEDPQDRVSTLKRHLSRSMSMSLG
jgi:hypothetical protein